MPMWYSQSLDMRHICICEIGGGKGGWRTAETGFRIIGSGCRMGGPTALSAEGGGALECLTDSDGLSVENKLHFPVSKADAI